METRDRKEGIGGAVGFDRMVELFTQTALFGAHECDQAMRGLVRGTAEIVGARQCSVWVARCCGSHDSPADWQVLSWELVATTQEHSEDVDDWVRQTPQISQCPFTHALLCGAGSDRSHRAIDLLPEAEWKSSLTYRLLYEPMGLTDVITVGLVLGPGHELYFAFSTGDVHGFSVEQRDIAAFLLQGPRRVWTEWARFHGYIEAERPLTRRECSVLEFLLIGKSEPDIAKQLGLTAGSTHQVVVSIYRKFSVRSRAELMSRWLNRGLHSE